MSFDDKKGIVVASGFKLQAETMLDARQQVDTIQERDELVTINAATPGLRVYVKNEKKSYVYNGTGWDELTTGAKYTHPTGDGYHHVPATGTTNNGKFLKAGSTAGSESWQNIKTSDITDFPTSLPTKNNMVVKFNGGATEGTNMFTFNGSAAKTVNITPAAIGAATSSHTHTPASIGAAAANHDHTSEDITDFDEAVEALLPSIPTKLPNPQGLTISLNGTSQGAYDGSAAKSINITASGIGAAASSHTHTHANISDFDDAVEALLPSIPTKLPNPQVLTFTGAVNDTYDGSAAKTINIPTSGSTDGDLVVQLNGGTTEDTNKFTFNGSDDKTINITPSRIGAAAASHTHNYAGSSSAGGAANSVKTSLIVKLNNGSSEGTNMFTFNGSAAKTINITPSSIGAAASSHSHTHASISDFDDAVEALLPSIPTKLPNPQGLTISLNGTSQGAYDGSATKSINITPSGIGAAAASHTHNYAGSSSAGGAANSVKTSLIVKLNSGSTEGTNMFTFNGSAAKTINITPSAIGAAASSHSHTHSSISDFDDAVEALIPSIPTKLPNPQVLTFTGAVNDTYDGSAAKTINIPTSGSTDGSLVIQLNGGTTEDNNKFTFNGSGNKTVNITPSKIGAAASSHSHNYAGSSSAGGAANSVKTSLVIKLNGGTTEGTNMFTFNGAAAKSINITPAAIGAAAASHGTHVTYGTDAPKANGTASAGSAASVSRSDHVHPAQTSVSGNAGSATKLATARTIDGVSFNGTSNITHYGTCSTAAGTAAKTVSLTGFTLATGAIVTVKFTVTNTAANPTLNVNGTGAKAIMYRGSAISAGYLAANRVYIFVYDGTDYELIGDINTDTNTTYNTGTSSTPGLTKLYTGTGSNTDGTMTQDAITDALTGKAPSNHTHNYAGSSSAGGAANSVKTSLVIKLNGGSTEGTNMFTFNGATAKSINITPSAIGAAASSHTHNYAGSSSAGGAATSANKLNATNLTNQNLNDYYSGVNFYYGAGGNTCTNKPSGVENFGMFVFQTAGGWWTQMLYGSDEDIYTRRWNGSNWSSWSKVYTTTNKPTASDIGAAASSHTHNYAGSSSAGGAANSVKTSLVIKLNSGTTEGTNMFTFNGGTAKTVNITPSAIGAAASSHTHTATQVTGLAASRALVSNASGQVAVSAVTATELGYLDGVTSAIQTQLNNKAASNHTHNYAGSSSAGGAANSAVKVNVPVGTVLFSTSNSTTFFNTCFGGTWTIVGNVVANIDAASGADSTLTLYMFRKTAA